MRGPAPVEATYGRLAAQVCRGFPDLRQAEADLRHVEADLRHTASAQRSGKTEGWTFCRVDSQNRLDGRFQVNVASKAAFLAKLNAALARRTLYSGDFASTRQKTAGAEGYDVAENRRGRGYDVAENLRGRGYDVAEKPPGQGGTKNRRPGKLPGPATVKDLCKA